MLLNKYLFALSFLRNILKGRTNIRKEVCIVKIILN